MKTPVDMQLSILLLSVVPVVLSRAAAPKPCCMSEQFTATIDETGGQIYQAKGGAPTLIDYQAKIQYDHKNKKLSVYRSGFKPDGTPEKYLIVNDYNVGESHLFTAGQCFINNAPSAPLQAPCIPANATYEGRSVMGSQGKSIPIDNWSAEIGGLSIHLAMTADGSCIPVRENWLGTLSGLTQQLTIVFYNVTSGIEDASVFSYDRSKCAPLPTSG